MCDKVTQETGMGQTNTPVPEGGYSQMYTPDGRRDIEDCIVMLRKRADELEGLLNAIPKTISKDAQSALQYLASQVWRNS